MEYTDKVKLIGQTDGGTVTQVREVPLIVARGHIKAILESAYGVEVVIKRIVSH